MNETLSGRQFPLMCYMIFVYAPWCHLVSWNLRPLIAALSVGQLPLISLWIFFSECRYSRPLRISLRIVAIWVSSRAPGSIFRKKNKQKPASGRRIINSTGVDSIAIEWLTYPKPKTQLWFRSIWAVLKFHERISLVIYYIQSKWTSTVYPKPDILLKTHQWATLGDMFPHYHEHTHCSIFGWIPQTPSCWLKSSLEHQMWIHLPLKIVKYKTVPPVQVTFTKNYSGHLFNKITKRLIFKKTIYEMFFFF